MDFISAVIVLTSPVFFIICYRYTLLICGDNQSVSPLCLKSCQPRAENARAGTSRGEIPHEKTNIISLTSFQRKNGYLPENDTHRVNSCTSFGSLLQIVLRMLLSTACKYSIVCSRQKHSLGPISSSKYRLQPLHSPHYCSSDSRSLVKIANEDVVSIVT